jgi:hypothetical protein
MILQQGPHSNRCCTLTIQDELMNVLSQFESSVENRRNGGSSSSLSCLTQARLTSSMPALGIELAPEVLGDKLATRSSSRSTTISLDSSCMMVSGETLAQVHTLDRTSVPLSATSSLRAMRSLRPPGQRIDIEEQVARLELMSDDLWSGSESPDQLIESCTFGRQVPQDSTIESKSLIPLCGTLLQNAEIPPVRPPRRRSGRVSPQPYCVPTESEFDIVNSGSTSCTPVMHMFHVPTESEFDIVSSGSTSCTPFVHALGDTDVLSENQVAIVMSGGLGLTIETFGPGDFDVLTKMQIMIAMSGGTSGNKVKREHLKTFMTRVSKFVSYLKSQSQPNDVTMAAPVALFKRHCEVEVKEQVDGKTVLRKVPKIEPQKNLLPEFGGPTLEFNASVGALSEDDDRPQKAWVCVVRNGFEVDEELYGSLLYKFVLKPRTKDMIDKACRAFDQELKAYKVMGQTAETIALIKRTTVLAVMAEVKRENKQLARVFKKHGSMYDQARVLSEGVHRSKILGCWSVERPLYRVPKTF